MVDLEYRKLIKFGNNSYVISLPKPWILKNRLEKGSHIYIIKSQNQLILSPQKQTKENEEKSITLDCRSELLETIKRKIISCYINNYKVIKILYSDNECAKEIRTIVQSLMALEVIEQTSNMIVARDYLNLHDISIANLIRKSDNIVRSIFKDTNEALKSRSFNSEFLDNVLSRDMDINRLTFVIMRGVKNALTDPQMKKEGSDFDYFNYYELAQFLEHIADELKRIIRILTVNKFRNYEDVTDVLIEMERIYLNMMKTYYNKDSEAAYKVATEKNLVLERILKYREESELPLVEIYDRIRQILMNIHNGLRLTYQ